MLVAMLYAVAERSYPATTVADVVARAAVSRTTFYAQFRDKEACFLAAYGYARRHIEAELEDATAGLSDQMPWRVRLAGEVAAYLEALASEPALALALHQEVLTVGGAALDERAQLLALLAGRVLHVNAIARAQEPDLPELPPEIFALYTGGLDELIRDRLRTAGPDGLRGLAEPLLRATIALFGL